MDLQFHNIIKNKLKLTKQQRVVIAFSGGMDSVCLLDLFRKNKFPIIVAHFNHGIRRNADRDENFARDISRKFGLEFVSEKADVPIFAKENHLSLEEAARKKRYEFLFRIAREKGAQAIAVGHHANDQVETMMMHLLRGSGLSGLTGMREITVNPEFDSEIIIIRPLLTFWRSEIEEYCQNHDLEFVVDETNASDLYERNRIRHEILPFLIDRYPGLYQRLLNMSNVVHYENEIIQELFTEIWDQICLERHSQYIRIKKAGLLNQPLGIQRRVIRWVAFSLKPRLRDLSYKNVENILNFLVSDKTGEIDLQENLLAVVTQKEIIFGSRSKDWVGLLFPQLEIPKELKIGLDHSIEISDNWSFEVSIIQKSENILMKNDNKFCALLDAEVVGEEIGLRVKRAGDRFQPLGMDEGTVKLSDMWINEKLLQAARKKWPLVINSNDEIIWIPGIRLHNRYRISDTTKNILKLTVVRNNC